MEKTKKEFIRYLRVLTDFWEKNEKCSSTRDRLERLMFSVLYLLDGKVSSIGEFTISTNKEVDNNISGDLSNLYYELKD